MTTFTTPPTNPSRSDPPATFITRADAFIAWFSTLYTELTAFCASLSLVSTTDTSSTSNAIGTGAKTFTVTAGKSFSPGMYLVIADTAAPSTNSMWGQVTSYSGTTLVMNILSVLGSGTKTAWTISQSASTLSYSSGTTVTGDILMQSGAAIEEAMSTVASATTPDIWTNTSNVINYTGNTTATGFAAATQAGQRRVLVLAGAAPFTAGANMLIDGVSSGTTLTLSAADRVEVIALTTTQFRLLPIKSDGTPASTSVATVQSTTSGTSKDFVSPISNPKRITVSAVGLSTSGSSNPMLQAGDAGGIEPTGYLGAVSNNAAASVAVANFTTGFGLAGATLSTNVLHVTAILTLQDPATNTWSCSVSGGRSDAAVSVSGGGSKTLSPGPLTTIRLTTVNGTDTFDAGSVNVIWE